MALTRRIQLAVMALFGFGAFFGFNAMLAFAATPCDQPVYDGAKVFKSGLPQVEKTAQKLNRLGADVRVFTVTTMSGQSNLDNFVKNVQSGCDSWKGPDGQRKNNLLVFAMALKERKV